MDNKRALKKILEELNADKPRIDYVKGMLEVLIGEEDRSTSSIMGGPINMPVPTIPPSPGSVTLDEGAMLDAVAKANLETVKNLSQQSNA